jgi:beta-fructofuranosidase
MNSPTKALGNATMSLAGALLLSATGTAGTVYIPKRGEWMWDTWVMQDGADYHLFHLSKDGGLGRAVSRDLIHWSQLPMIPNLAKPGDWDEKGMLLTGSTVKHNGKYYLSYGSKHPEPLGFLVSDDLKNWNRLGSPVLPAKEPYKHAWRDLTNVWDPARKLWDGYLCAEYNGLPCVGHVSSPDLLRWSHHKPHFVSEAYNRDNNGFVEFEVPDYFEMDGKHYITFSSIRSRKNLVSGREDAAGTWFLMSDKKEGPYRVPANPLLMGTGMGRIDHYVGRTITHKGKRLMYCQNWGDFTGCNWSTPKLVQADKNHELYLGYWQELDVLKKNCIFSTDSLSVKSDPDKRYKIHDLEGVKAADFMLTCEMDVTKARSVTLTWRSVLPLQPPQCEKTLTYGLRVDPREGQFSLVQVYPKLHFGGNTYQTFLNDRYTNPEVCGGKMKLRLMVRKDRSEVYINDRWIFNVGFRDFQPEGGFSILAESGEVNLSNLEIHELEPL